MTFKDLVFKDSKSGLSQCVVLFPNKRGVSIIFGYGAYGDRKNPYECAEIVHDYELDKPIMNDSDKNVWELTYDNYGDVVGYCDENKVNKLLKEIEER